MFFSFEVCRIIKILWNNWLWGDGKLEQYGKKRLAGNCKYNVFFLSHLSQPYVVQITFFSRLHAHTFITDDFFPFFASLSLTHSLTSCRFLLPSVFFLCITGRFKKKKKKNTKMGMRKDCNKWLQPHTWIHEWVWGVIVWISYFYRVGNENVMLLKPKKRERKKILVLRLRKDFIFYFFFCSES